MKKVVIAIVLAAVVAFAGYMYFGKDNGVSPYRTAKVEKGEIVDAITATGTINAVTTVSVGSQVSGTIQQIFVDFNSRVRKGQVIALIDPRLLEAAVEQARANVNNAKASLERAQVGLIDTERTNRRNRELVKDGFVAQADVDSSQTAWEQAAAQKRSAEAVLQQAEGALRVARTNLEYATIRSPVDGIVISRTVDVGQTVAASFQTPTLFSIAEDLTKMQVDTNVDESDIGRAALGQNVKFTVDAWPEKTFAGEVTQVRNSPIVTQNVVTYNVVVRVDNRELLLKPGMTANVSIEVKKFGDVLKIPNAALRYRPATKGTTTDSAGKRQGNGRGQGKEPGGQRVYLLGKDGKPVPVPIKAGASNGTFTVVEEGNLKEGDLLLTGETQEKKAGGDATPPGMGMGRMR
jgi:HlyD family secretion protein